MNMTCKISSQKCNYTLANAACLNRVIKYCSTSNIFFSKVFKSGNTVSWRECSVLKKIFDPVTRA